MQLGPGLLGRKPSNQCFATGGCVLLLLYCCDSGPRWWGYRAVQDNAAKLWGSLRCSISPKIHPGPPVWGWKDGASASASAGVVASLPLLMHAVSRSVWVLDRERSNEDRLLGSMQVSFILEGRQD